MTKTANPLPVASRETGLKILQGLVRERSLLTALSLMRRHVGRAFQITLPRFRPAVLVGPDANRQVLVQLRHKLLWRSESDPVTRLLRRGVLVVDGEEHDAIRGLMDPTLQRRHVVSHIPAFWHYTGSVSEGWLDGEEQDMLVEMRRIALLILVGTLFKVDFSPDLDRLWHPILRLLEYISPGLWIIWPHMPRPQYRKAIAAVDDYLYSIISRRRAALRGAGEQDLEPGDLLGRLLVTSDLSDGCIRDQLLTMLIAGHDTSTALLAWALYLLGSHPDAMAQAQAEVGAVLSGRTTPPTLEQVNGLAYLDQVIKEALRLYPPIHVGNRRAGEDLAVSGYRIPAGTRVMYSIYLSHRDEGYWHRPERFCPARFERNEGEKVAPFTYVPFGGGPRNCIGAAFAQVEAKVVLGRLLQTFDLELLNGPEVRPTMGATLEPRPGVRMRVRRRRNGHAL